MTSLPFQFPELAGEHLPIGLLLLWGLWRSARLFLRYIVEPVAVEPAQEDLAALFSRRAFQEAKLLCTQRSDAFHRVAFECLCEGLRRPELLPSVLYEATWRETHRLRKGLEELGLLAQLSFCFGLLGTLFGILQGFRALAHLPQAAELRTEALASVLQSALHATALGLAVSIVLLLCSAYLTQRHTRIVQSLDAGTTWLAQQLPGYFAVPDEVRTWRQAGAKAPF